MTSRLLAVRPDKEKLEAKTYIEYYIKEQMNARPELANFKEYVHFTCTSEDINNVSYAMMLTAARKEVLSPEFKNLYDELASLADKTKSAKMISRTHGQSATPTTESSALFEMNLREEHEAKHGVPGRPDTFGPDSVPRQTALDDRMEASNESQGL